MLWSQFLFSVTVKGRMCLPSHGFIEVKSSTVEQRKLDLESTGRLHDEPPPPPRLSPSAWSYVSPPFLGGATLLRDASTLPAKSAAPYTTVAKVGSHWEP